MAPKGNQLQLPNTPLNAVNLGRSTDPRALLSLNTRGVVLAGKLSLAGGVAISAGQAIDRAGQPGANLPEIGLKLGTDVGAAYVTGLFPYGTVIGVAYFILDPTIPVPRTFPMPAYTGDARYDRVLGR